MPGYSFYIIKHMLDPLLRMHITLYQIECSA